MTTTRMCTLLSWPTSGYKSEGTYKKKQKKKKKGNAEASHSDSINTVPEDESSAYMRPKKATVISFSKKILPDEVTSDVHKLPLHSTSSAHQTAIVSNTRVQSFHCDRYVFEDGVVV